MFAVVYLVDSKKHIVVPKKFIFGLSKQNLYNYGKNKHKFLVYWSKVLFDDPAAENCEPNFGLDVTPNYPSALNETCFMVHIKYFFGKHKFFPSLDLRPMNNIFRMYA